jgi:glutaredoxin-related protein
MIIAGLDPGFTGGAVVVLESNDPTNPLWYAYWGPCTGDTGRIMASNVASVLHRKFPNAQLYYELPYVKVFLRKVDSAKAYKEIQERGYYSIPASSSKTAIMLGECVGMFTTYYPSTNVGLTPSEWRGLAGGLKGSTKPKGPKSQGGIGSTSKAQHKANARATALHYLNSSNPIAITIRDCEWLDHLSDAYMIAVAGQKHQSFRRFRAI